MTARVFNVNVGVLGHVDSGKTSLVAALSTSLSTAALDKNPQSKERGITLDLGFSSFTVPLPAHLRQLPYDELQFTLVDCPGHASLIKTIIGGAQIIDLMILVVDVTKGIQAQTAECLVVGEIATQHLLVALNKTDLLPAEARQKLIAKAKKRLGQTFAATKFASCSMVAVSAKPGGGEGPGPGAAGLDELTQQLVQLVPAQPRSPSGAFLFAIDHCFGIKGQGTVLTGTVLQGGLKLNDPLELPELKLARKVKSMQMFKKPVQSCVQGDRVGICVTQLDAKLVERGIACSPGSVPTFTGAIVALEKIRFFAGKVLSKAKLHLTVGHATVMGEAQFFGVPDEEGQNPALALQSLVKRVGQLALKDNVPVFDFTREYLFQEELYGLDGRPQAPASTAHDRQHPHYGPQWALVKFSQPVTAPHDALMIGSRFDADMNSATCRLACYGRVAALIDPANPQELQKLKIYKVKQKTGVVERVSKDGTSAICRSLFKKETDISLFTGMKVVTSAGEVGTIEGPFGKSGKFKVHFAGGVAPAAEGSAKQLTLTFKRYIFDHNKRHMAQ
ncbi:hypothetical protein WJX72_007434 [[Myrmecia] bisecta]|uniref:Selenocysteine-specific elongation factor n=1 Tax=[Myrmecia] bisecta TaxID=41462 RepID=A0AAW1QBT6_9CHLO